MVSKPSPPNPPDPRETAGAQTATNIGTSIANTASQNVNQITPEGSITYNQTGTHTYRDPNTGKTHYIPTWTATTSLSDENQAIYDQSQGAQLGLATTANQQAQFLEDYLGEPADFDTSEIEGRLYDLASPRLDSRFSDQEDALRTRLANQGIQAGSEAFEREMRGLGQGRNDAYNQLMLQGRGQAFGEMQAERNQPINEITALLSGSQVSQPNFPVNTPAGIPTTDIAGLTQANYAQQMGNYQQQMGQYNSIMGGLFGLGGSGIRAGAGLI